MSKDLLQEMPILSRDFWKVGDLTKIILAIDGTHMPIEAPTEQYINRKGWYSIVFQIVVDSKYIIREVFGGYSSSSHDTFVDAASSFENYVNNEMAHPYVVIGDSAYPSEDHLLIPFGGDLSRDQELFNTRQPSQRMGVEGTIEE